MVHKIKNKSIKLSYDVPYSCGCSSTKITLEVLDVYLSLLCRSLINIHVTTSSQLQLT